MAFEDKTKDTGATIITTKEEDTTSEEVVKEWEVVSTTMVIKKIATMTTTTTTTTQTPVTMSTMEVANNIMPEEQTNATLAATTALTNNTKTDFHTINTRFKVQKLKPSKQFIQQKVRHQTIKQ